ncbi:phosphotransferase family protein [Dactylosporangium sucinum]|uniref:Acyl-CoA dehydrogenase n=1 Tax=Dactylosporangium sucinum TaxID=1424081 RepID=A0A917U7T9_9ACTN|nr:phosphotransferase family protein [Dactylosporangium sucinum]GGM64479.1 acyl-CoA dehydrogenase [Dactylosporangium sucinum]
MAIAAPALDATALTSWLDDNGIPGKDEGLTVEPLSGGMTNLVYRLRRGGQDLVLRMAPGGMSERAGRTMVREYAVLTALEGTAVPHARAWALGADPAVLGGTFYVMDYVDGWSPAASDLWPAPFDADAALRRALALELVEGAAKLSRVDWEARGLSGLGRPDGFHERQVDRWLRQFNEIAFRPLPGLQDAAAWLRGNQPASWSPGIMHGDYQFHNVMYAHGAPARLAAIVDWELSTIGDPLLDLAWVLMSRDWNESKFDLTGMPPDAELVAHYEQHSGRSTAGIDYYLVLARFKMAVILEGGVARSRTDARHERAGSFADISVNLAAEAGAMARRLS